MIKLIEVLVEIVLVIVIILEIIKDIKNRAGSDQTDNPKDDKEQ